MSPRAGQRRLDVRHLIGEIAPGCGRRIQLAILGQQHLRQRLQPALARHRGARLALGLIGPVEVLHGLERDCRVQLRGQLVGQLLLGGDLGFDRISSLGQLAQVFQPLPDVPDLHLVQPARDLFAVARDEGDGIAVIQEADGRRDLGKRNA